MKRTALYIFIAIWISVSGLVPPGASVQAQGADITWGRVVNLSKSVSTSTDPFLLADPAGIAHLFWAEKKGVAPGNQADTIIYTAWDGVSWSAPVDIFLSPITDGNPMATFPRAVMDEKGIIHLLWMSQPNFPNFSLNFSSAPSWLASESGAWDPPRKIALDLTGQKYSADIAYNAEQGLHVAYARGIGRESGRGVAYLQSLDGGKTWSDPMNIYVTSYPNRGASDVRVLLDPPNRVYVTWTEWDNSGNGQAVYFTSSDDNGKTWVTPFPLAERRGNEYERDWNNMTLLGPNQIVSVWEGGFRAFRGSMVSKDGGATWTQPVDAFPWLIGDNGSVEFVRDGSGTLHLFLANRVREGFDPLYGDKFGLWHSVWQADERWSEPTLQSLNGGEENMTNPKVTVIRGNQIVAVWYGSSIYEIMAQVGQIQGAAEIPPKPWDKTLARPVEPTPAENITLPETPVPTPTPRPTILPTFLTDQESVVSAGTPIYVGLLPAAGIILLVFIINYRRSRDR